MKIRNIIGLILALPILFFSCGEDSDIMPDPPVSEIVTAPTQLATPSATTYALHTYAPTQEVFKLTWDPDIHRLQNPQFVIQMDVAGNNFAAAKSLGTTKDSSFSVTAQNLDTTIVKSLGNKVNKAKEYEIRVVTTQGASVIASSTSNAVKFNLTPYSGYPEELYFYVKGSDVTKMPKFTTLGEGLFELKIDLNGGEEYQYIPNLPSEPRRFIASSTTIKEAASIIQLNQSQFNQYSPAFTGTKSSYIISVDFTKNTTMISYSFPENLYLVGTINDWNVGEAPAFTKVSDGIFEIVRDLKPGDEFKYVQERSWNKPDFISSSTVVGEDAKLLPGNGSNSPKFTDNAGSYKIRIDFTNMSSKITSALPDHVYLTGDAYKGWSWDAGNYAELVPVWGTPGVFWTVIYLKPGGFKFSPVPAWNGDFGISTDNTSAIGDYTIGTKNINVASEGYYQILVNVGSKTISITTPKVVLKGDAASAGWDATFATDPFTVNTANKKEMISPAFAKNAELRMFVQLPGIDWWKSEFIVLDGKIAFRGTGPDQQRVTVTQGKTVTLNFDTGTGVIN